MVKEPANGQKVYLPPSLAQQVEEIRVSDGDLKLSETARRLIRLGILVRKEKMKVG